MWLSLVSLSPDLRMFCMHYYLFSIAATKGRLKEHRGVAMAIMWYAMRWISYWAMVYAMRWRIGDEGIAFLFLLRACYHDITAAIVLVIAEPAPRPMLGRYRAERLYLLLRTVLYLFFSYLSIYIFINYTLYFIYKLFIHRLTIIIYLIS